MQNTSVTNLTHFAPLQAAPCSLRSTAKKQRKACARPVQIRAEAEDKARPSEEASWKLPISGSDTDWRAFRARLVAGESAEPSTSNEDFCTGAEESWAHVIGEPERGCLILAHPLMFSQNQTYFNKAVILLINHDDSGTAGIILNKPLDQRIESLQGAEGLRPEFDKNTLFLGGDVGDRTGGNVMQLLHNQKQLPKSIELVDGIYMGGHEAARMAVRKGELDPVSTCRWYCQYAGWAPGQLQSEINKGVWFTVAASKDLIMHPSSFESNSQQWHTVLQKMGGDYKQLSDALEDSKRVLLADLEKVDPNVNHLQRMVEAEKKKEESSDENDKESS